MLKFEAKDRFCDGLLETAVEQINKKLCVFISHSNILSKIGGVEKYILADERQLNKLDVDALQIYGYKKKISILGLIKFKIPLYGVNFNQTSLFTDLKFHHLLSFLELLLQKNLIISFNIHHLFRWYHKEQLLNFLESCKKPIFIYLHDFYFRCGSTFLLKNKEYYCGAADIDNFDINECKTCIFGNQKLIKHSQIFARFFDLATNIIVPSQIVLRALNHYYPDQQKQQKTILSEWTSFEFLCAKKTKILVGNDKIKIAFIGRPSAEKGFPVFSELADDIKLSESYQFYAIGGIDFKHRNINKIEISYKQNSSGVEGDNLSNDVIKALSENEIDIVFLWSVVPESYSFTAHEAFACALPILTSTISGNIVDKIRNNIFYGKIFQSSQQLKLFLSDRRAVIDFIKNNPNKSLYKITHKSFLINWFVNAI